MYDAIVVGAGPAGSRAATQIAAAGFRLLVLEKKKVVGEPVQCAEGVSHFGLVSNGIEPRAEWVIQRIGGAACVFPNRARAEITHLPGYTLDRAAFDAWLVQRAIDRGAELRTSVRVTGIERHDGVWRIRAGPDTYWARIVIAADGPASLLARTLGLLRHQDLIRAYEYRFRAEDVPDRDPDAFLLFVAERYDGGYAWIFPRGEEVNVGAGGHIDAHAAALAFCREHGIDPRSRTKVLAGTIPYRFVLEAYGVPGFAVAGDAAGLANPMNGAGIHAALFSGRLAGDFAVAALGQEDLRVLEGYDRVLRSSPFLDPLLFEMIEHIRTWDDRLLSAIGEALDGGSWRDVDLRLILSVALRRPWMALHSRSFRRMARALELCEHYGW